MLTYNSDDVPRVQEEDMGMCHPLSPPVFDILLHIKNEICRTNNEVRIIVILTFE